MTEIYLSIFFITILLLFLSTGVWVALSMIGVSTIAITLFTSRPVGEQWQLLYGAPPLHGL